MNNAGTWFLKGAWIELGIEQALVNVIETACRRYSTESALPLRVLTHTREVLVRKNETWAFMPLFEGTCLASSCSRNGWSQCRRLSSVLL
jgi:hypothetical protein